MRAFAPQTVFAARNDWDSLTAMSKPELLSSSPPLALARAELLARGFTSDVYDWEQGRVLKLFFPGLPHEKAEREFRVTRAVHAAGLPAPAAFEVIEIDG